MLVPSPCVVDTNVPIVANNRSKEPISPTLLKESVEVLVEITASGHVVLDVEGEIIGEYRKYLAGSGQPGVGDMFFKWLLTNQYNAERCTLVRITKVAGSRFYREFPDDRELAAFDPADRKFVAVAVTNADRTAIIQGTDCKWIGWAKALSKWRVDVFFLAEDELRKAYVKKCRKR